MANNSSILVWRIPPTEEIVGYSSQGCKELDMTEVSQHTHMHKLGFSQLLWAPGSPVIYMDHKFKCLHDLASGLS